MLGFQTLIIYGENEMFFLCSRPEKCCFDLNSGSKNKFHDNRGGFRRGRIGRARSPFLD